MSGYLQVTIHNINESKFLLRHQQQVPISNHVEITRVPMGARKKSNVEGRFSVLVSTIIYYNNIAI